MGSCHHLSKPAASLFTSRLTLPLPFRLQSLWGCLQFIAGASSTSPFNTAGVHCGLWALLQVKLTSSSNACNTDRGESFLRGSQHQAYWQRRTWKHTALNTHETQRPVFKMFPLSGWILYHKCKRKKPQPSTSSHTKIRNTHIKGSFPSCLTVQLLIL